MNSRGGARPPKEEPRGLGRGVTERVRTITSPVWEGVTTGRVLVIEPSKTGLR